MRRSLVARLCSSSRNYRIAAVRYEVGGVCVEGDDVVWFLLPCHQEDLLAGLTFSFEG